MIVDVAIGSNLFNKFRALHSTRRNVGAQSRKALCLTPVVVYWVLLAASAPATIYYVSTTGNDTNSGTSTNNPFRTIQKGAATAVAGDTVYVRGGTYYEGPVTLSRAGSSSARITLAAYPGETPVVDGNNYFLPDTAIAGTDPTNGTTFVWEPLIRVTGSYTTVNGFEVSRSHGRGITVKGGFNQVVNCNVHDTRHAGIMLEMAHDVTVSNCVVSGAGNYAPYDRPAEQPNWPAALACNLATNVLIQDCTVFNNWGEGIGPYGSERVVIEDSASYDNYAANVYLGHTAYVTVRRNLVYHTGSAPWLRKGFPAEGILVADETWRPPEDPMGTDQIIVNNFVSGCSQNFGFWFAGVSASGLKNALIAYNTFVDSSGTNAFKGCFNIEDGSHTNVQIKNNIIAQARTNIPIAVIAQNPQLIFSHNLWSRPVSGIQSSPADVVADPQLARAGPTNPGQWMPDWFKLLSTSPARNRARALAQVTGDHFRAPRDSTPDIGGHEFGFESWQMSYFGCASCSPAIASADPDGDGQDNLAEYVAGTNPTNPTSAFGLTSVIRNGDDSCTITWQSVGGMRYRVQYSDGDTAGGYNGVFTDIVRPQAEETDPNSPGTPATMGFTDDYTFTPAPPAGRRYYRVRVTPE